MGDALPTVALWYSSIRPARNSFTRRGVALLLIISFG